MSETTELTPLRVVYLAGCGSNGSCADCGADVWAFKEGLICSGCDRVPAETESSKQQTEHGDEK